jgi:uncharacterized metal-binding protein/predicted Fe-Mo cluster-binding NifX family protein
MRFGIPLMADRVAPRCTFAHSILIVASDRGRITYQEKVSFEINTIIDLISVLEDHEVDTLICGGISVVEIRELNQSLSIEVIDNVSGSSDEIVTAVKDSKIHPGFGISPPGTTDAVPSTLSIGERSRLISGESPGQVIRKQAADASIGSIHCLDCKERVCLRGEACHLGLMSSGDGLSGEGLRIMQSVASMTRKHEGKLCRLAELVNFCLEMKYKRVGIAFCMDLVKQAEIVAEVLRRFLEVFPVCCKVVSSREREASPENGVGINHVQLAERIPCNPVAQAEILNLADTDLNVILGLSLGADCVFTQVSRAPVTTLLVKDRLAEDIPICVAYSKNSLAEITVLPTRDDQSG